MKHRFPQRAYADFFSGPGRCVLYDGTGEFDGTPLCALQSKEAFSEYHLVEQATELFQALRSRASTSPRLGSVRWYNEDANVAVRNIRAAIHPDTLVLAVIDPTGLHFHFDSLETLTKDRRVDFIYLFPDGMDVRRNLERYLAKDHSERRTPEILQFSSRNELFNYSSRKYDLWIRTIANRVGFVFINAWDFTRVGTITSRMAEKEGWESTRIRCNANEKRRLLEMYGNVCFWCGKTPLEKGDCTVDHVIDAARGGSSELPNLRIACVSCNSRRNRETQVRNPVTVERVRNTKPTASSFGIEALRLAIASMLHYVHDQSV